MSVKTHAFNTIVPHRRNGYKPHAIRHYGLLSVLVLVVLMQGVFNWQTAGSFKVLGYATNVSIGDLLSLTNQNRASNGLSGLSLNSQLNSAAQSKAQHMIANDYWAHTAPDGTTPWYFIGYSGYAYEKAGENLAYGFNSSSGTVQGWMDSPGHRANILDNSFKDVGFGIANGSNFQGGENTVVVAMYGQPTIAPAPVAAATAPAQAQPVAAVPAPQAAQPAAAEPEAVAEEVFEEVVAEEPQEELGQDLNKLLRTNIDESIAVSTGSLEELNAVKGSSITNFSALINGQAHWSMYVSLGAIMAIAVVYAMRHAASMYQVVVHGEQYVVGHPLLEASLIYAAVWMVLAGTFGVVL